MKADYYAVLGIHFDAGPGEIKKAYRELARKLHPDYNPGDESAEEHFKLVTEAYEILSDTDKKADYDQKIIASQNAERKKTGDEQFYMHSDEMVRDFMHGFYTGRSPKKKRRRYGDNIRFNLKISFEESALGAEKEIRVPGEKPCPQCRGTGLKAGARPVRCTKCRGQGKVKNNRGIHEICRQCAGAGSVYTSLCKRCEGYGVVKSARLIQVHVPPGIETGTRLKVGGLGVPGDDGGKPGDFIVVVHVKRHPFFERSGNDVSCSVPVPLHIALSGGSTNVPLLEGQRRVHIPPGSKDGKQVRFRGKGMRLPETGRRGDLIVRIQVEMPKTIGADVEKRGAELASADFADVFPKSAKYQKKLERLRGENAGAQKTE